MRWTPFGKLGGGLAGYQATELGSIVIRAALERAGIEPHEPQYAIMGQVLQAGAGQAPARQAAIGAGLPLETPSDTINKVCASSIRAVEIADSMIRAGDCERRRHRRDGVDVECALRADAGALRLSRSATGSLIDLMIHDGLVSSFDGRHMVEQASFVSRELGISREEQDAWALRSHRRAVAAIDAGRFADEIVPVGELDGRREPAARHVAREARGARAACSTREGTTTAGNAPGVNDGASCVRRGERGVGARARDRAARDDRRAGLRRRRLSPTSRARRRRPPRSRSSAPGKTIDDVARVEINEAFSSVA